MTRLEGEVADRVRLGAALMETAQQAALEHQRQLLAQVPATHLLKLRLYVPFDVYLVSQLYDECIVFIDRTSYS